MITIKNLEQDLQATSASNQFRSVYGMAKARNPYSWYKYVFVALCYYNQGTTFSDVLLDLQSVGVGNIQKTYSGLMKKVANQMERDSVQRNYAINLPGIAAALGLVTAGKVYTGARPADVFKFKNPNLARSILVQTYPETIPLFALLDKKKF
jgi:hypothetical protein